MRLIQPKLKCLILLTLTILFAVPSFGQIQNWRRYRYELSLGVGPSNFLGDLGGSEDVGANYFKDINFLATRYAISAGLRYRINEYLAIRTNLTYGRLYGSDKLSQNFNRNYRNLDFRTNIFEGTITMEGSLFKEGLGHRYRLRGPVGIRAFDLYPYIFLGIGLFYFNPQGTYKGHWVDLQPLTTEGQGMVPTRKKYSRVQMVIPLGIGVKYTIDQRWGVGIEYGFRTTFTDYIDDASQTYFDNDLLDEQRSFLASQMGDKSTGEHPESTAAGQERGNPNNTDAYMFTIISVNYRLRTDNQFKFHSRYYKNVSPLW
jgi:hypothetical protein